MRTQKEYDIFISYSSQDEKLAREICEFLELKGLRCWIAFRDIKPSYDYPSSIIKAIQSSYIMIVILSEFSNNSPYVLNEVERAFSNSLPIIPFLTKKISLSQSLEFFLARMQWFNATDGNIYKYFEELYLHSWQLLPVIKPIAQDLKPAGSKQLLKTEIVKRFNNKNILFLLSMVILLIAVMSFVKYVFTRNDTELKNQTEISTRAVTQQKTNLLNYVFIEGGTFNMGDLFGDGKSNEKPVHIVKLDNFYISKYEVTFDEFDGFCDETQREKPVDNGWGRGRRPVINISWEDAVSYCKWLSKKTGKEFRLPTEAEWEYACRGGRLSKNFRFSGGNNLNDVGWFGSNSGKSTHEVGLKNPNELGLFDMTGNVWEWCSDWNNEKYYTFCPTKNPKGPADGTSHVVRGGSWNSPSFKCRVSFRSHFSPSNPFNYLGFRCAFDL